MKTQVKSSHHWTERLLFNLSLFLLVFIPLYPKLPLMEAIPGYLVRVRLEDFLILLTAIVWLAQFMRKKIDLTTFHWWIIGYAVVGAISLLTAVFLQQTIPLEFIHISKSILHYLRYLEYFSLFFFLYAGIKDQRQVKLILTALVIVLNLIFIYGLGQRYLQLPAFSTMNREYSKGQALILSTDTKLHSTFGGHYDLAAYLVIALPILASWALRTKTKQKLLQVWLGLSILGGLWLLLESASKTALAGCLLALVGVIWFSLYQRWGLIKSTLITLLSGLLLSSVVLGGLWRQQRSTFYQLLPFLRPANYQTPVDVTPAVDETWSVNARKYGLSMGIRLDTLWPNALYSFSLNPYTGKGYATLNKAGVNEFTDADSTDNNYLRFLGETGLLGWAAFFGVTWLMIKTLSSKLPQHNLLQSLVVGFIAGTLGLLVNAFIIDVFAASKVAFTYWALAGLTLKSFTLAHPLLVKKQEGQRLKKTLNWLQDRWPVLIATTLLILLVHKRPLSEYSLVKSFALSTSQAHYVATTKCLVKEKNINHCLTKYQPKLGLVYSLYLIPFYALYAEPAVFYFANLILLFLTVKFLSSVIKKLAPNHWIEFSLLTIIFTTSVFYNLPSQSSPFNLYLPLSLWVISRLINNNAGGKFVPNWLILGLLTTYLIILNSKTNLIQGILASWRDTYRPSDYVAVRRANRYLSTRVFTDKPPPILLTAVDPIIFDLYGQDGQGSYQLQPINLQNIAAHQQLVRNSDQELFITNANVAQNPKLNQAFKNYKQQFGVTLQEIDCRLACNYYQLLPEEVEIPTQPKAWNRLALPAHDVQDLNFIVISDEIVLQLATNQYLTEKQLALKNELIAQKPDLIFLVGDNEEDRLKNFGNIFLKRIYPELKAPIVAIPNNFNHPQHSWPSPQYQRFSWGENWYVTLDAADHHTSPAQNRFVYDTLLQLEKHPQIKRVYFISADDSWLQQHPDNFYFWQDFPQELEKVTNVKFEFIYPQQMT